MGLALDWQSQGAGARIAVSGSSGSLSVLQAREAALDVQSEWTAHTLEVWSTAFHRSEAHWLFSGADDSQFRLWDLRCEPPAASFTDRKTHAAGVCTISPHPRRHELLATGSYDEGVRLWDLRSMARPVVAAQASTGGGNWRLKWHPTDDGRLLAAAMYNGFAVLRAAEGPADAGGAGSSFQQLRVEEAYTGHGSIAYGADWCHAGVGPVGRDLVATCSFYDKLLHVWRPSSLPACA